MAGFGFAPLGNLGMGGLFSGMMPLPGAGLPKFPGAQVPLQGQPPPWIQNDYWAPDRAQVLADPTRWGTGPFGNGPDQQGTNYFRNPATGVQRQTTDPNAPGYDPGVAGWPKWPSGLQTFTNTIGGGAVGSAMSPFLGTLFGAGAGNALSNLGTGGSSYGGSYTRDPATTRFGVGQPTSSIYQQG